MISYDDIKSGKAAMPAVKAVAGLPALVAAAAAQLATAGTAAEVLDAKDKASLIYDAAKRAARLAAAKGAHDTLIAAAHRAQANALKIEAQAKERLADEYDAAQERGEIQKPGGDRKTIVPEQNNDAAKVEESGLTRKQVHDARRVRNAEIVSPGVVEATVEKALADGKEPTRAMVNAAVAEALGEEKPADKPRIILDELVALWCEAGPEDRDGFIAYLRINGFIPSSNPEPSDVDRSAERASSAVEVGAPVSPEGATKSQPVVTDQASDANTAIGLAGPAMPGSHPAANTKPAKDLPIGGKSTRPSAPAESVSDEISVSHSQPNSSPDAGMAGEPQDRNEPVSGLPATQFNNPRCLNACHLAHSKDACHECLVAWSHRPRDEQIRLWAEANAERAV